VGEFALEGFRQPVADYNALAVREKRLSPRSSRTAAAD
jgi:hypothetical protein